ncbi:MAG: hypothetical protein R3F02_00615 [Thiolinea sp.]
MKLTHLATTCILPALLLISCSSNRSGSATTADTPNFAQQCENSGGRWVRGGIAGFYGCLRPARDAGKSCTDSSECEYHCNASAGSSPAAGSPASGQCQSDNNYSGCNIEIRKGIAQPRYCVKI